MIEFNGRKFAENNREVIDSLFRSGGTVSGIAKRKARSIDLFELNGQHVGTITGNGIVAKVTLQEGGKPWYSYGWPDIAGPELSLSDTREAVEALAIRKGWGARGERAYWFK